MKPIAVTAPTRLPVLPSVPTFAESGIADFDVKALRGILAPRGTPKAIVSRLSGELAKILAETSGKPVAPFVEASSRIVRAMGLLARNANAKLVIRDLLVNVKN